MKRLDNKSVGGGGEGFGGRKGAKSERSFVPARVLFVVRWTAFREGAKKKVVIECLIYFAFGGGDETVRIDFGAGCERASAGWVRQSS